MDNLVDLLIQHTTIQHLLIFTTNSRINLFIYVLYIHLKYVHNNFPLYLWFAGKQNEAGTIY